jgi:hypothetical protein
MSGNIDPTPTMPTTFEMPGSRQQAVKPATPDLIIFNQAAQTVDALTNLIFEDIGGQELINILRHDTVLGKNLRYEPVSNLKEISYAYNPNNIFTVPGTLDKFFKNFAIRLDTHVVESNKGTGPNGETLYIDRLSGNPSQQNRLVIDVVNMETNEQVEIQILESGAYLDGIINSEENQ